jgi:hypothetical protein
MIDKSCTVTRWPIRAREDKKLWPHKQRRFIRLLPTCCDVLAEARARAKFCMESTFPRCVFVYFRSCHLACSVRLFVPRLLHITGAACIPVWLFRQSNRSCRQSCLVHKTTKTSYGPLPGTVALCTTFTQVQHKSTNPPPPTHTHIHQHPPPTPTTRTHPLICSNTYTKILVCD